MDYRAARPAKKAMIEYLMMIIFGDGDDDDDKWCVRFMRHWLDI